MLEEINEYNKKTDNVNLDSDVYDDEYPFHKNTQNRSQKTNIFSKILDKNDLKTNTKIFFKLLIRFCFFAFYLLRKAAVESFNYIKTFFLENSKRPTEEDSFTKRQSLILMLDGIISFFSLFVTARIVEAEFSEYSSGFLIKNMLVFFMITFSVFLFFGTHRKYYSYSKKDSIPIFVAVLISSVIFLPFMNLIGRLESFSDITPFVNILVCTMLICFPRYLFQRIKLALGKNDSSEPERDIRDIEENFERPETGPGFMRPILSTKPQMRVLLVGNAENINSFLETDDLSMYSMLTFFGIITNGNNLNMNKIPIIGSMRNIYSFIQNIKDDFDCFLVIGEGMEPSEKKLLSKISEHVGRPILQQFPRSNVSIAS